MSHPTMLVSVWLRDLKRRGLIPRGKEIERVPNLEKDAVEAKWVAYYRALGCDLLNVKPGGKDGKHLRPRGKRETKPSKPRRMSLKEAKEFARAHVAKERAAGRWRNP